MKLKLFTLARHDQDSAGQRWAVIYYITGALSPGLPPAPSPTAWVDATPIVQFAWSAEVAQSIIILWWFAERAGRIEILDGVSIIDIA